MEEKRMDEEAQQLVDYIMPSSSRPLFWKSPKVENISFWVFWSEEKASNHASTSLDHQISIQHRIKTALYDLKLCFCGDVLAQYWAATTTMTDEGCPRSVLTTADQPFALNCLTNEKLNQYKKNCPNYKLVDQGEEDNLTDGSICRVFRTQWPEMSMGISYYSVKEYPERELALACGIKSTFTLPVFEPSLHCCVGVLEFLFTSYPYFLGVGLDIDMVIRAIEEAGLQTVHPSSKIKYIPNITFIEKQELKGTMEQVRETHGLPVVNLWTRGSLNKSFNTSDVVNFGEDFLYNIPEIEPYDRITLGYYDFDQLTPPLPLRVGQGPVGKVFYSDKPCFCIDVTQLSIIHYPMAHFVRGSRFKSCFAVCLQSVATKNRVYALELFLPPDKIQREDLHNFLSSILTTLKQHLQSYEVVTGDIGNYFFTEIDSSTKVNVEASMLKGKNVILAEQGSTSLTQNTFTASSGYETTRLSTEFTSFHTLSLSNTYSGNETISSSKEFTSYKTISISDQGAEYGNETISSSGEFTSYKTMSVSAQGAEDSARSLRSRSIDSTLNNTSRKLRVNIRPFGNKSYFNWSTSMISEHMHSETGSSTVFKLFGCTMTVSQNQVPRMNDIMGDSSLSDGPRSEGSVVVPRTVLPLSTEDVEMVDVNENYEEGL